jgi:hypothetical protein
VVEELAEQAKVEEIDFVPTYSVEQMGQRILHGEELAL